MQAKRLLHVDQDLPELMSQDVKGISMYIGGHLIKLVGSVGALPTEGPQFIP